MYDVIIIGNGPAGLSAGIYAKRAGFNALMISDSPLAGGQITSTYEVDNYPGLPKISGFDLGDKMKEHADNFGMEYETGRVKEIKSVGKTKVLVTDKDKEYEAKAVIIATGAEHRKLNVPGEDDLTGMGVSYCATCDGAFFRNKTVAVVGGGDVALEDAIFLSRFAAKVYLIHRRDAFRGAKVLQDQVLSNEKITPVYDTVVDEIVGNDKVEKVIVTNKKTGAKSEIELDGVFVAVGIGPNLNGIAGLPNRDEAGYIIAGEDCETSLSGIYAAGDVRTKQLRQVITAAADGANAVTSIEKYFNEQM